MYDQSPIALMQINMPVAALDPIEQQRLRKVCPE
jgi:hypothetical protein